MEDQAAESEATLPAESSQEQEQQEAQPTGEPADVKDIAKDEEVTEQAAEEVPPNEDSVEPQTEVKDEEQSAEVAATPKPDDAEEATPEQETQGEEATKADEESEVKEPATESGEGEGEEQNAPDVLPTSESFTEGEAPETGPVVADALSRGQTPPAEEELVLGDEDDRPQPGTPERAESEVLEPEALLDFEQEFEVPVYNREELLQKYQEALHSREQLNQQNYALQHKLADYFRKKKTDEARQEVDKNVADQDQRYMKYMSNLDELRQQESNERETYTMQLEEMKERKAEKQTRVEEEWTKAIEFKNAVAAAAINSRSGRPIPAKDIEMYEANERRKEAEVSQVRLENIKLKNRLRKQEMQLKQKEELAEGLHLIDFEQLKIENQTYNEKIEERNEELLKLRKKITSTVQVLTHLKEKLQFVQAENQVRKQQLAEVEQEVAQKRDILSRTKQARDALRHDNNKLQQKCGLLGNSDLLRDFEVSTDEVDDLYQRLDILKRSHAALTLTLNGVKKKIELAKENKV